jgi:hypothetical protein
MGAACDQRACHPRCTEHGTCRDGKCECSPGWNGEHCTIGRAASPRAPCLLCRALRAGLGPIACGEGPKVLSSGDIITGFS